MFYLVISAVVRRRQLTLISFRTDRGAWRLILLGAAREAQVVRALFGVAWTDLDFETNGPRLGVCLVGRWFSWPRPAPLGPFGPRRPRAIIKWPENRKGSAWKRQS